MARTFSTLLSAAEYHRLVRAIALERGITLRSAERALQRYAGGQGRAPEPVRQTIQQARTIDGSTYPGVSAGKDVTFSASQIYSDSARATLSEISSQINANATAIDAAKAAKRAARQHGYRRSPIYHDAIVSITVRRVTSGQTVEEYDPVAGSFSNVRILKGKETYVGEVAYNSTLI